MTMGKTTALVAALVGALALGVFIGPFVWDRDSVSSNRTVSRAVRPAAGADEAPRAATATARAPESRATAPSKAAKPAVASSEPALHQQVKPLLNRGADVAVAAEGFESGEQFATVAHAARNTEIPFMLLKHRVLTEHKSLAAAIQESKPDLDARSEANRARAAAREDIAKLQS